MAGSVAVWLDVTHRYCVKTAKPILKLFRPYGSPIVLVFFDPGADTQLKGNPLAWAIITRGGKNWRFSTEIAVYLGEGAI